MAVVDSRPFHFQLFSLFHHRSTMKVGTDAVLLGIWTPLDRVTHVLDIGTGCGILPLLLAARAENVRVDAVDLDGDSVEEARENFSRSPYAERLQAFCTDIREADVLGKTQYDLIISNPPFFRNDQRPVREKRKQARHTDTLSYAQLAEAVVRFLKPGGRFSVVLPYRESRFFLEEAARRALFLQQRMLIFPKPCREPNRVNLLLGKEALPFISTEKLVIREEDGAFTRQYLHMVKNYYLST